MNPSKHLLALSALLMLAACGGKEEAAQPAPEATAEAPAVATSEPAAPAPDAGAEPASGPGVDASALYAGRCASCHGQLAEGQGGNPSLVGLSAADIQTKLEGYRAGTTLGPKTAVMAPMAKSLTDEQIQALASYLGG